MARVAMKFYDIPDIIELGKQEADPKKKMLINMDGVTAKSHGDHIYMDLRPENFADYIENYPQVTDTNYSFSRELYLDDNGVYYVIDASSRYYVSNPNQIRVKADTVIFEFHVNPQRVSITESKLQTEIRTRGGWETQHWGNQLGEISLNGHTGGMHKKLGPGGGVIPLGELDTVVDSIAWKKLTQLKDIYYRNNAERNKEQKLLSINYYGDLYTGYFKDFKGPDSDAERPYLIDYSFVFKIVDRIKVEGWVDLSAG